MEDSDVSTRDELERLYREEGNRIWWSLLAYSGDREIADDAVAEAFMRALRDAREIREPLPWLWRVSFRVASAELGRRKKEGSAEDDRAAGSYEMDAPSNSVLSVMTHLTPRQRAALILHYYGGYSAREIGDIVGASATTVAVHMHQGRRRLRRILEESDG